ncbi:putative ABC transport system permease protein [Caldanaerovirga acetigignens]|uniref:Putative ABC transport system permease protein n=1 Tax=Caldanaerovirga acetigignens TaxID=447595 RepID=A0A1M7L6C4_9FIRM|nr:ABC transporter permease [Caldanaerovirga acetigignens]SHM72897.1 putative ABC transport system permease protein [Caldanaerovirga acetigignens]
MSFFAHTAMALRSISRKKMRSLLTMLGVIIGVASVITLVAITQGTASRIEESIKSLGANLIGINITGRGPEGSLSYDEFEKLASNNPYITAAAPVSSTRLKAIYKGEDLDVNLIGTTAEYPEVRNLTVARGRFFTKSEVDERRSVAVIGNAVAEELFPGENPLGKELRVKNRIFEIIGVLASQGSTVSGSEDEVIYVPITVSRTLTGSSGIRQVFMQAKSAETVQLAINHATAELLKKFKNDEDSFRIFDQTQMLATVQETTGAMSAMLGGIAAISLLVGGIGIMNIMLVSVTERTREIGIRKALGATRSDIMTQFLIESIILSGSGGAIGVLTGFAAASVLSRTLNVSVKFSPPFILIAFSFSLIVGVFFGLYPASRASALNPVEALRYE